MALQQNPKETWPVKIPTKRAFSRRVVRFESRQADPGGRAACTRLPFRTQIGIMLPVFFILRMIDILTRSLADFL